jgi:urease accessory protein
MEAMGDLVTLAADSRQPDVVGRTARLEMRFEQRGGRTVLTHSYAEPPFRTGGVFDLDGAAYVIIVCAGPGIFGGDTLLQSIHVGPGATVVMASQSALQVHPDGLDRTAVVRHCYRVDDDAELRCQWDPVIPFTGSRLDQQFELRLAPSSRLYWTEALMAGRVSRDERWRFASLAHELSVQTASSLVYLERYALDPSDREVTRRWITDEATHLATMLVCHARADRDAVDSVQCRLAESGLGGIGVDLLEPGVVVARLMESGGAAFARARASYRAFVMEAIFGGAEPVARK